jgi:hypothetical protein
MLICKECHESEDTKLPYEPDQNWQEAEKVYEQCEFCLRSTLCAEL